MRSVGIQRVWQRRGASGKLLWLLLLPASWAYRFAVAFRNFLYRWKCARVHALDCPIISIGNLSVGGTGKTPATLWLARRLMERGYKVGILSRGYKRKGSGSVILSGDDSMSSTTIDGSEALTAGDEPVMMARIYGFSVSVAKNRYQAGLELLAKKSMDVLILDDGFQHRKLKRDFDLVLLGEDVPGWLLPCGPFREPARSLRRADCFLVTGAAERWQRWIQANGARPSFQAMVQPQALIGFESDQRKEYPLTLLYRSKILAVAGIAKPANFYQTIHEYDGDIVDTLEYPDHHDYSAADWQQINRIARDVDLIVTTEKDILKLMRFPFARGKLLALRVSMAVAREEDLLDLVIGTIRKHGLQNEDGDNRSPALSV
jgi:tetraacyldisaccharide 4'-kinase